LLYEYVSEPEEPWLIRLLAERAKADLSQEAVLYVRWPVTLAML
jgi:hypothetical protein